MKDIDDDELDQVNGGWAGGVYINTGINVFGNGPSYTMSIGTDGIHFYQTQSTGVGDGASASVGAGVWGSRTDGAGFFTGSGTSASVGLQEGLNLTGDASQNSNGFSIGASIGVGGSLTVVGASVSHTETTENNYFNPQPGQGAPGDTYIPAYANPDGSITPGQFVDARPGSLADQAGFNDIEHAAHAPDSPSDHPTDGPSDHPTDGPSDHPTDGPSDHPTDGTDHANDSNNGNDFGDHNNDGGGGNTQVADAGNDGGGGFDGGGGGDAFA